MANIAIYDPNDSLVANRVLQYLTSVHTPNYAEQDNVLINPNIPVCSIKYWKKYGKNVIEMNAGEKAIIDQAEADAQAQAEINAKDIEVSLEKLTKAFALVTLDEINILRNNAGLSERTLEQLKIAIVNKYDIL